MGIQTLFNEVFNNYKNNLNNKSEVLYLEQNKIRYLETVLSLDNIIKKKTSEIKVLDIGTSPFTFILNKLFDVSIYTIDIDDQYKATCENEQVFFSQVNLNKGEIPLPDLEFDIILFSEVIEHLTVSPNIILNELSRLMKKNGLLIIQTPNFACLKNILLMIKAENIQAPIEMITNQTNGDIHFHEYTMPELESHLKTLNFIIIDKKYMCYWDNYHTIKNSERFKISYLPIFASYILFVKIFPKYRRGIQILCSKQ